MSSFNKSSSLRFALLWLSLGISLCIVPVIIIRSFFETRYIPASSMEPTLKTNDRILVNKNYNSPKRGDVVIFKPTETLLEQKFKYDFIKRVIGLPGDTIEIKEGKVYVNQKPLQEKYIAQPPDYIYGPVKVPANAYFMLGDNRNNSYDSHYWGFVPKDNITGRAIKIYWPLNRAKEID